ncbi:hypothetical protein QTH90_29570 [Variovorax sp. J2P1-59]|uniref:hypothetical protein n=1 Tax=Variovorax flavidus TaxID=3053501 RepID=UPI0025781C34|nr:hypothetical protein [Variovorax sp. J2P1-59]MDM0078589.1 hypothetical protein [Variovorax sp. J2P1-59]
MAHPICALARRPDDPPDGENSPPTINDPAALARQVDDAVSATKEAHRAIICLRELLEHALSPSSGKDHLKRNEVGALAELVYAEFERRTHVALATIASMPVTNTAKG